MGLFTSYCVNCQRKITWFGHPVPTIKCSDCGTHNSAEWIELSWDLYWASGRDGLSPEFKEHLIKTFHKYIDTIGES